MPVLKDFPTPADVDIKSVVTEGTTMVVEFAHDGTAYRMIAPFSDAYYHEMGDWTTQHFVNGTWEAIDLALPDDDNSLISLVVVWAGTMDTWNSSPDDDDDNDNDITTMFTYHPVNAA